MSIEENKALVLRFVEEVQCQHNLGRPVNVDVMDILTVAGGRITEHWTVADYLGMMQQLGVA